MSRRIGRGAAMSVTSARQDVGPDRVPRRLALAVADANWYTTENLFGELRRPGVSTLLLRCEDYRNAWRRGIRPWSRRPGLVAGGPNLWRRNLVLPSGWMKSYPAIGMRPIRRTIESWRADHAAGAPLALVMTYPHYLYLRDQLRPDRLVYFNIDDYAFYWPRRARTLDALERRAVREADLTVCASLRRCQALREAVPEAAERIRHLPHGSPSLVVAQNSVEGKGPRPTDLADLPGPLLGYVGSLEDRIDWNLLGRLADAFPAASIVLIGRLAPNSSGRWLADFRKCLSRPNVHALGWRPQAEVGRYNAAFDVCLIPYRADHPFNLASCPTKIMDYMATGRPIVSTALPECQLYGHLFDVAPDHEAFLDAVGAILAAGSDDGRSDSRHAWARANTCQMVVERLLDWLAE